MKSIINYFKELELATSAPGSSQAVKPPQKAVNTEEIVSSLKNKFTSADDFSLLSKRVAKMETTFSELTTKVDGIIIKLDQLGQKQKQAKYDQFTTKQSGGSKDSSKEGSKK